MCFFFLSFNSNKKKNWYANECISFVSKHELSNTVQHSTEPEKNENEN